jgi:hypothetical protein
MRSILIALLMTFATQAGAWIYDDNFALRNTMQMAVSIRDSARGGCWTNLRESREYAEEKLRISGAKVRDKTEFEPNALLGSYYFEIYVHARRENKDGSGGCQGTIIISIYGNALLNGQNHVAAIFENSFITSQAVNLNNDILEAIGISFADLE